MAALRGVVKRSDGTAVTSGTVTLSGTYNGSNYARTAQHRIGRELLVRGQPAIAVTLTAWVPHPQGTANSGTLAATLSAGQATQDVTITLPGTGSVTGTVRTGAGTAAANVAVSLSGSAFSRSMRTDTAGALSFGLVPAGTYTLTATEPASSLTTTASVTVAADQATVQDLQLVSVGIVRGTVKDANNTVSAGSSIQLTPSVTSRGTLWASTDASGSYQFTGVPLGSFRVTATNLSLGQYGETTGVLASDGQQAVADITMVSNVIALPSPARRQQLDVRLPAGREDPDRVQQRVPGPVSLHERQLWRGEADVIAGGTETAFGGAANALGENGNRELAITQAGVAGLDVTRKVYVATPATSPAISKSSRIQGRARSRLT